MQENSGRSSKGTAAPQKVLTVTYLTQELTLLFITKLLSQNFDGIGGDSKYCSLGSRRNTICSYDVIRENRQSLLFPASTLSLLTRKNA